MEEHRRVVGESKIVHLNLTSRYASSWGTWEGIREFIQNWHDGIYDASEEELEQRLYKTQIVNFHCVTENQNEVVYNAKVQIGFGRPEIYGSLHYDICNKRLTLVNRKISLQKKILLLGYSSKSKHKDVIGQFGEGLKIGALALVRQGRYITMETNSERWKFALHPYEQFGGEPGLVVVVSKSTRAHTEVEEEHLDLMFPPCPVVLKEEDTSTSISSVSEEEFKECRENFLFLTPPNDKVQTEIGTLLLDKRFAGKLFVKGSYVLDLKEEGLQTGVDFCELQIDRDRNAVPQLSEIDHKVSCMWPRALESRPDLASRYYKLLVEHVDSRDVRHANIYAIGDDSKVPMLIANEFAKGKPPNIFPVSSAFSPHDVASLQQELGQPVVQCNDVVLSMLHKSGRYKTLEVARAELKPNKEDVKPLTRLTKKELKVLEQSVRTANIVDPELKVEIIDVIDSKKDERPSVRGDRIEIPLWMVKTEEVHRYGQLCRPDGSKGKHTCWCRQIRLCNALLSLRKDNIPDKIGRHPKESPPDLALIAILAQFTGKEHEKTVPYCLAIHQQGQLLDYDGVHANCVEKEEIQRKKIKHIKMELMQSQKEHQEALANLNHDITVVRKDLMNNMVRDADVDLKMEELETHFRQQLQKYKETVQGELQRKDEEIAEMNEVLLDAQKDLIHKQTMLQKQEDHVERFSKCLDHRHTVMVEKVTHFKMVLQKKADEVKDMNTSKKTTKYVQTLCQQVAGTCVEICSELEGQAYMCFTCRGKQRSYMALPCCHYKFCEDCAPKLKGKTCPVLKCKERVDDMKKMFE
ncbi:uncharacterized protein LOC144450773 [Glandiceps talaboti]